MKHHETGLIQGRAYRLLEIHLTKLLEKYDLLIPEWKLLGQLSLHNKIRPAELAALLGVKRPFITRLMQSLTEKKLLDSKVEKLDKRAQSITLTSKAEKMLEEIEIDVKKYLQDMFKGVSIVEIGIYVRVLMKIIENGEKLIKDAERL
ncbi:MAG: MarR family transcriptional regulator [Patescibacteria group bacterium]